MTTTDDETDETFTRPALDVLAELRRGRLKDELTDALHELLLAVQDTGKKGDLVLKLTVDPKKVPDFETPQVSISDLITVRKPRRPALPSTFFLTDDGNPVRRDPAQDDLFQGLTEVPTTSTSPSTSDRKAN